MKSTQLKNHALPSSSLFPPPRSLGSQAWYARSISSVGTVGASMRWRMVGGGTSAGGRARDWLAFPRVRTRWSSRCRYRVFSALCSRDSRTQRRSNVCCTQPFLKVWVQERAPAVWWDPVLEMWRRHVRCLIIFLHMAPKDSQASQLPHWVLSVLKDPGLSETN